MQVLIKQEGPGRISPDQGPIETFADIQIATKPRAAIAILNLVFPVLSIRERVHRTLVSATRAAPDDCVSGYS
jgi:hypothetical protein